MIQHVPLGRLDAVIAQLRSLSDGEAGVSAAIAFGPGIVPSLKDLLFAREPSGLYEVRRHAVDALAGLRASEVLREFLKSEHLASDPIETAGNDAVLNEAARVLGRQKKVEDIPVLRALLKERTRPGVIEALGGFLRIGDLPFFIDALADDYSGPAAMAAIRAFGTRARSALLTRVLHPICDQGREIRPSVYVRRAILRLLTEQPRPLPAAFPIRFLIMDDDPIIAFLAASLCLASKGADSRQAARRVIALLERANPAFAHDIQSVLIDRFSIAADLIEAELAKPDPEPDVPIWRRHDLTRPVLEAVKALGAGRSDIRCAS
jgi:HEAT repeat protein